MAHGYVAIQHGFAWGVLGRGRSSRKWDQREGFGSWLHRSFYLIQCRFHCQGNLDSLKLIDKRMYTLGFNTSVKLRSIFSKGLDFGLNWKTLEEQVDFLQHVRFEPDLVGGLAWRMQPFGWLKRGLQTAFPEAGHNREWIYVRRDGIRLWLKVSCCIVKGISPPVVSEHSKVCRSEKVERPEGNSEKQDWMCNK